MKLIGMNSHKFTSDDLIAFTALVSLNWQTVDIIEGYKLTIVFVSKLC